RCQGRSAGVSAVRASGPGSQRERPEVNSLDLLSQFPPHERVYAVLDGARDSRLRGWIFDTRFPRWCLYRGTLTPQLEDAAPWLVALQRGDASTQRFLARFWGSAYGILLSSDLPSRLVRRHLRRFLLAQTEQGQVLLFRYYDPRVLRVYVPTLTPEESRRFFGGISTLVAEGAEPDRFHVFHRDAMPAAQPAAASRAGTARGG